MALLFFLFGEQLSNVNLFLTFNDNTYFTQNIEEKQ